MNINISGKVNGHLLDLSMNIQFHVAEGVDWRIIELEWP